MLCRTPTNVTTTNVTPTNITTTKTAAATTNQTGTTDNTINTTITITTTSTIATTAPTDIRDLSTIQDRSHLYHNGQFMLLIDEPTTHNLTSDYITELFLVELLYNAFFIVDKGYLDISIC